MDCSPPGSYVHGIFQARTLEWVAISYSRGSSWPGDRTECRVSPAFAGGYFLTTFPIQGMGNHKKTCRRKLKMVFIWGPECQFQRDGSKGREPQIKPREEKDLRSFTEIEQAQYFHVNLYNVSSGLGWFRIWSLFVCFLFWRREK